MRGRTGAAALFLPIGDPVGWKRVLVAMVGLMSIGSMIAAVAPTRRPRTGGGESIQIKWKIDGRYQSETFTDPRLAAELRTAVELAGHRGPRVG